MAASSGKQLVGEQLVERGLISREELKEALRVQARTGEPLGRVLVGMGLVEEEVMAEILGIRRVTLGSHLDADLLKTVPEQLLRRHRVVPLQKQGNRLVVAMADPLNVVAIDDLRLVMGMEIEPVLASDKEIELVLQRYLEIPSIEKAFQEFDVLTEAQEPEVVQLEEEVDEAPVVRLVNSLFVQAVEEDASDIHIEPQEHHVRVRFRVDGVLREVMVLPRKVRAALASRLKIMAGMDIAEKRLPQDGRIQIRFGQRDIDLRVSSLPTNFGEKIVIRILDKGSIRHYKIDRLGFRPANLARFREMLRHTHGMILVTGPTGSGKTTTLYTVLNELNSPEVNIVTVEDPIEYLLEGINQTQVHVKAGLTFAAGLRAILRQDPDIIMVGEIRDTETAQIAVRAAITGHLVLSTLHTNDAAGAVTRLVDMGIEPFLVASSLLGVVAQRLVRRICPHCREAYSPAADDPERLFLGLPPDRPVTLYRGRGCGRCRNTGYRGRMAIHEVLAVTPALRPLIARRATAGEIAEAAAAEGTTSLRSDGVAKALEGLTTVQEVMRVAYAE
ncbi:MAG: type II secretion system ATPase GspE [Firmicutes bacterium]|nr:type II secretion system ATPase GspE [Bacillota bacterium]